MSEQLPLFFFDYFSRRYHFYDKPLHCPFNKKAPHDKSSPRIITTMGTSQKRECTIEFLRNNSTFVISKLGYLFKSSRSQMFFKIDVLKNFATVTGKQLCWSPRNRCFPVNIAKFLRTALFIEHLWWLLLLIAVYSSFSINLFRKTGFLMFSGGLKR